MRHTGREAEYGPESKAVACSEEGPVGDRTRQSPERPVFAAQEIIGEIHSSQHVERTADNADQRKCVFVHHQRCHLWKSHGLAIVQHEKRLVMGTRDEAPLWRVDTLIPQLERAVVDRDAGPGA